MLYLIKLVNVTDKILDTVYSIALILYCLLDELFVSWSDIYL